MRTSTVVVILCLAAGVALSAALPLPASRFGLAGVNLNKPLPPLPHPRPPRGPRPLPSRPDPLPKHLPQSLPPPQQRQPKRPPGPPSFVHQSPPFVYQPPSLASMHQSQRLQQPVPQSAAPYWKLSLYPHMSVQRELFERVDQRIKLAARAYVRELLTTPMDDLD